MTPPLEKEESELVHRRPSPADELTPPHTPEQNPCKSTSKSPLKFIVEFCLTFFADGKGIDPIDPALLPSDRHIPDNYVSYTIANQKYLPPITWKNLIHNIQWISFLALTVTPSLAIYGIFTTAWNTKTAIWR